MDLKLIGVIMIVSASSWAGFGAAAGVLRSLRQLSQLKLSLELMHCEIEYRLTPFRKLCALLSASCKGEVSRLYQTLASQAERGNSISEAAAAALEQCRGLQLPLAIRERLRELLDSFGNYDTGGQLRLIELTQAQIEQAISTLTAEKRSRCRCYRVLGICTGLALAILVA